MKAKRNVKNLDEERRRLRKQEMAEFREKLTALLEQIPPEKYPAVLKKWDEIGRPKRAEGI